MKEAKVYTGRRNGKHAELMQRLDKALKEQHFAFVFTKQELKVHDRELVRQVFEKIRKKVDNISMHTATKERLMLMCEEIEKEYEK